MKKSEWNTNALRKKVLDLAIQGKLLTQNKKEEPASFLLERICREKQQLAQDGRLKKKDLKHDSIIFRGSDKLHYEKLGDISDCYCFQDFQK